MAKHGGKVVFFGRFITVLRFTAAWVAGIARDAMVEVPVLERSRGNLLGDAGRARRVLRGRRGG